MISEVRKNEIFYCKCSGPRCTFSGPQINVYEYATLVVGGIFGLFLGKGEIIIARKPRFHGR
jgi:hypothetical protein